MQKAIFTIVSNNYLHYARTLLQSVARHHPECERFCVIVDKDQAPVEAFAGEFTVIRLSELELPDVRQFLFRYSILELNTAVKPWAFAHLLSIGYEDVVYIDPDIRLYAPLVEVFGLLAADADLVVTPHLLAPMTDDKEPTELSIRVAGTYNFGFCALTKSANARSFIAWWQTKLVFDCVVDQARGIFVDQSWIDLVPGMFPRVAILRHPGYNVAYWNLAQRPVRQVGDGWTVNGEPLVFFHYSGFNPEYPEPFSKHQNRFSFENLGEVKSLAVDYAAALIANGARTLRQLPYGYACFADGLTLISDLFRKVYREDRRLQALMGDDPFQHPEVLATPLEGTGSVGHSPTYAMYAVWKARADVQEAFPLTDQESVARFYEWFEANGQEYFSPSVVQAHAALYERMRSPAGSRPPTLEVGMFTRASFVRQLYFSVLGREADKDGLDIYATVATTRLGIARVCAALVLSSESRTRPHWRLRAARGVRLALAQMFGAPMGKLPPEAAASRDDVSLAPAGWYTADGDVAEHGCWVAPAASFPCVAGGGSAIRIEGNYFASYVRQQHGASGTEMSVSLGHDRVASQVLDHDGPFSIEARIPDGVPARLSALRITASSYFVPKTIGLNDDDRQLSWRAGLVQVDGNRLLDRARVPVLLPLDRIAGADGVNVVGYIASESGVGESARSFVRACRAAAISCRMVDVGYQSANRQTDRSAAVEPESDTRLKFNVLHVNADQTPRTLQAISTEQHTAGGVNVAYWHWEQSALPVHYLSSFDGLSEVWVPSSFVQQAVAHIAPIPVFKVPHAIEFAVPEDRSRATFGLPDGLFLVLVMYDFDSYQYRKNPQAAVAAFRAAYGSRRDVGLVIKTINGDRNAEAFEELKASVGDLENVFFLDDYLARSEVYALQNACDCFLSLHRAEGFGLGLAEMMYLGKPVVATDWSGNTEFMTLANSCPVRYELKPLKEDLGVYQAGQLWAEADIDHAAHLLRRLVDEADYRGHVAGQAYRDIRRFHSAAVIGSLYRKRLALLSLRR